MRWCVGNKLNILIIDESLRDVTRIACELQAQGFDHVLCRVESAGQFENGPPGVAVPDVILSEWHPYGFDGCALLVRCRDWYPGVPFVFVTQRVDPGLIVEMFENGAAGHVSKRELYSLGEVLRRALVTGAQEPSIAELPSKFQTAVPAGTIEPVTSIPAPRFDSSVVHSLCPSCKRVGDERGLWAPIELHLRMFLRATVELAECPRCRQVGRAG